MGLLQNKVACVTGGGSGIGRATALRFAKEGAKVVVADINRDKAESVAAEIVAAGGEAKAIQSDAARDADVRAMVDLAVTAFGRLDVAFNAAGSPGPWKGITEISEQEWDDTITINVKSAFLCLKHEIAAMLKTGGGAIVTTSSAAIHRPGIAPNPDYHAAKAAVLALTRNVAAFYAGQNIRVNAVLPGAVLTPMLMAGLESGGATTDDVAAGTPMKRVGEADEIANAVVWLCSDQASFVTGIPFTADGGLQLS